RLARRAPAPVAVAGEAGHPTYGALDREANRLAHHLRRLRITHGDRVALVIEPSPELVTAALAVWKAGGIYVPLDPGAPPERLAGMMKDAGASVLLSRAFLPSPGVGREGDGRGAGGEGRTAAPPYTLPVLPIDAGRPPWAPESAAAPPRATGPADLACIIYTSGSTGVPKGAVLSHRGLLNLARWHQRTFSLTPADHTAMV